MSNLLDEYNRELMEALERLAARVERLEREIDKIAAERKDAPSVRDVTYLPAHPVVGQLIYISDSYILGWRGQLGWDPLMKGFWVTWNGENWMSDDHQKMG